MTTQNPVYASQAKPWLKYYAQKYIDQTLPTLSAFDYVCHRNRNHLNDTALDYYGRKFTYADLIVNVKKTAAALRGVGVKKGDIVTVVSVMTPEVIALFYAADMVGATLNLVDPRYSVEGIHEYIEEVDSHLLVCLNVVYERCRQAAKRTNVEKVIVLSPADSLPPVMAVGYKLTTPDKNKYASNVIRWKQFIKGGDGQSTAAEPYDPDHACVVVHTGGTTGSPKGVMLTDNCFNAIAQQFRAYDKLFHRGQKLMNIMPPFIAYGYACGVHLPLVLGFTVIIIPNLDPAKLGSLVLKYKPEHMFGVPAHYQQLAADPKLRDKDLSFILNYAAGGDSIARGAEQTVNDFLAAHGVRYPIAKGYGMTEVSSAATVAAGLDNKPGSVGIPIISEEVKIKNPDENGEGEICVKGPNVMLGYFDDPEATAAVFDEDGFFRTGDYGRIEEVDGDKWIYITGRLKNLIIFSNGKNVYPEEIETELSRIRGVLEVVVYAGESKKDPGKEVIVAEIYPDFEQLEADGVADIQAYFNEHVRDANARMAPYKKVGLVKIRKTEFVKNTSKKITRFNIDKSID